jgi:hypothetical protein
VATKVWVVSFTNLIVYDVPEFGKDMSHTTRGPGTSSNSFVPVLIGTSYPATVSEEEFSMLRGVIHHGMLM